MASRRQTYELTELRVLRHLSEPAFAERGATETELRHALSAYPKYPAGMVGIGYMLPRMKESGLIGRQETPDLLNRGAKPYFITDEGKQRLEEVQRKAMMLEPSQHRSWGDEVEGPARQALAEFVRRLPEFDGSDEARVQEVAGQLRRLTESLSRGDALQDGHRRKLESRRDAVGPGR